MSAADVCGNTCSCAPGDCGWKKKRSSAAEEYVVIPARGNVRRGR
jgi:hypothetical protein